MAMWNLFKKPTAMPVVAMPASTPGVFEDTAPVEQSEAEEIVATALAPAPAPAPTIILPATHILLKPMKWVMFENRVAIVFALDSSGYATIHFVDATGATTSSARVPGGMLQLARLAQIPEPRRPRDVAYAATLGYV